MHPRRARRLGLYAWHGRCSYQSVEAHRDENGELGRGERKDRPGRPVRRSAPPAGWSAGSRERNAAIHAEALAFRCARTRSVPAHGRSDGVLRTGGGVDVGAVAEVADHRRADARRSRGLCRLGWCPERPAVLSRDRVMAATTSRGRAPPIARRRDEVDDLKPCKDIKHQAQRGG